MSMTIETAQRVAELAQERVGLLERLADVEREMGSMLTFQENGQQASAARAVPSRKGGKGITVIGKRGKADEGAKLPDLPNLLAKIAAEEGRPLKIADFVLLARAAGYVTEAKNFPNMVYQALLKLVKRGVLEKDNESRDYHYIQAA